MKASMPMKSVPPTAASAGDRENMANGLSSCKMRPATLEMKKRANHSTFDQKGASCMRTGGARALAARLLLLLQSSRALRPGWPCAALSGTTHRAAAPSCVSGAAGGASSESVTAASWPSIFCEEPKDACHERVSRG